MPTTRALGIDAEGKAGWVGEIVDAGGYVDCSVGSLADLIAWAEPVTAIGIDIPIGLLPTGHRAADLADRAFVGPRGSSVFAAPPAAALKHDFYQAANAALEADGITKMSRQTWALLPKIVEAQTFAGDDRIIEVHPEVSFRALANEPIQWPKKTWNGQTLRRQQLAKADINLPDDLGDAGRVLLMTFWMLLSPRGPPFVTQTARQFPCQRISSSIRPGDESPSGTDATHAN